NLRVVLGADHRVDVQAEAVGEFFFERIERADAIERLRPVAGHAAYAIMRRAITVERDVEVEIDLRIATQGSLDDLIDVSFDQRIRRDDDAADAVVLDKEINDLAEIAPQRRLAA